MTLRIKYLFGATSYVGRPAVRFSSETPEGIRLKPVGPATLFLLPFPRVICHKKHYSDKRLDTLTARRRQLMGAR